MKKVVLIFGSIAGIILAAMLMISLPYMMKGNMDGGAMWGYTTMIIALTSIFFGVKVYRDKHLDGYVSFGNAFKVGIFISLVASFLYALGWEITLLMYDITGMEFMDFYLECQAKTMAKDGASVSEITAMKDKEMSNYGWYDNIILRFLWTMLFECFIMGVIVSLISALILRKKNKTTATMA